ncbi:MAG: tRNA (N6-isopentenyl adenosine(37)-C2)-methylthiotransferase MiaB [Oscillospiraceae bacterium]|nr:tRNA (N6-isopentenyl adenosine(37)-C2)-methylthiotransferase MiaB [Oscillospiraceae bacterium]
MDKKIISEIKNINEKKPSKPKACMVTFGCQQNEADSEKIKGMLEAMGYEVIDADMTQDISGNFGQFDEKSVLGSCDLIILNTCAVREHAELKAFSRTGQLKHYKNKNKELKIGLCGCMVEQKHAIEYIKNSFAHVDFVFGTRALHKFPEILYEVLTNTKRVLENESDDIGDIINEDLPVLRDSFFKARVSIMYGCDNFCSYCVVPYVRGREKSRDKDKITEEIRELVASGYKDITLLGQNVNSYKDPMRPDYRFVDLLADILGIEGDYWLRFITSHPKDVSDDLIALMGENEKLARHFHLPVQAGSDRILKLMNRKYTGEVYLGLIEKLKKNVKDIAIASDIIVGFPGETEQDFQKTLDLVEKAQFDTIFPFIYSKRENTPAASFEDKTPHKEKTERFIRLMQLQNSITEKKNKAYEGKTVRVLVEGEAKNAKNIEDGKTYMAGRTTAHKLVTFEGGLDLAGNFADVKITAGKLHGLYGDIEKS